MNKKIIMFVTSILVLASVTVGYGYSKKLTDMEYVTTMKTVISETYSKANHKGGSKFKAFFGDVDNNYLKPELDALNILKLGCENIKEKASTLDIRNKDTRELNNIIISKYEDSIELLDKDIAAKEKILKSNGTDADKYTMINKLDITIEEKIENNLYDVNTMLQKLEIKSIN